MSKASRLWNYALNSPRQFSHIRWSNQTENDVCWVNFAFQEWRRIPGRTQWSGTAHIIKKAVAHYTSAASSWQFVLNGFNSQILSTTGKSYLLSLNIFNVCSLLHILSLRTVESVSSADTTCEDRITCRHSATFSHHAPCKDALLSIEVKNHETESNRMKQSVCEGGGVWFGRHVFNEHTLALWKNT